MEFSSKNIGAGCDFLLQGGSSQPRDQTHVSYISSLQVDSLPQSHQRSSKEGLKINKTIYEALKVTNSAVMEALDGLPPVKVHCSLLAEEAIHAALWDYAEKHDIKIEGLEKPKSDIHEDEEEESEEY